MTESLFLATESVRINQAAIRSLTIQAAIRSLTIQAAIRSVTIQVAAAKYHYHKVSSVRFRAELAFQPASSEHETTFLLELRYLYATLDVWTFVMGYGFR